jgi:hypothetical protein
VCVCLLQDRPAIAAHCFTEGMKLEAVDPTSPFCISPATVIKVTTSLLAQSHLRLLELSDYVLLRPEIIIMTGLDDDSTVVKALQPTQQFQLYCCCIFSPPRSVVTSGLGE